MINVWSLCHLVLGCSEELAVHPCYIDWFLPSCTLSTRILKCNSRHSKANHLKLSLVKFTLAGLAIEVSECTTFAMSTDHVVGSLFDS